MCNVAGYVGHAPAAPILLAMMEKQEGFGGGYYSGIATVADGRLYHAKVIGDIATLRRDTDAERLPGTTGIIHSRSKSGGDVEWAHPFVDCTERMAYIANGHAGFYATMRDQDSVAGRLAKAGHTFRSKTRDPIGEYPLLPDGSCVHTSEVVCHLIESLVDESGPVQAMRKAFMTFPAEIVGLMVHAEIPECVVVSRFNQPLMIGRDADATYLSTTAMAFPEEGIDWLMPAPTNTTAAVHRDRIELSPFTPPPGKVADVFPWEMGRQAALEVLSDGTGKGLGAFKNAVAPLWPADTAPQKDMMAYEILRALHREGRIRFENVAVPGVIEGTTVPQRRAFPL